MPTRIQEVRVTFTWFERLTSVWDAATPVALSFLQSQSRYAAQFQNAGASGKTEALTLPWTIESEQYRHWFWTYYLQRAPRTLTGAQAFRLLVPLRSGFDCKIKCEKVWVTVIPDAFYYPHGVGLVATLKLYLDRDVWPKKGVSLETAVQKSIEAWSEYRYDLNWGGGSVSGTLDVVCRELMRHVRERVLAANCPEGSGDPKPFSIAAVVRGSFDRPDEALTVGPDWQHSVQGLCNLRKPWQRANLYPLKDAALRIRRSVPGGHYLYHSDRGRAIWFPSCFADSAEARNRSVSCYQRNLTLLHLQTTGLIEVLRSQADLVQAGTAVAQVLSGLAGEAAAQLAVVYGSTSGTYRSSSPRAYIDEHPEIKALIESVLGRKLSYTATAT